MKATAQQYGIILSFYVTAAAGVTYCSALPRYSSLPSITTIVQNSISVLVNSSESVIRVPITGLTPSTDYDVYCYSQGLGGNGMSLTQVMQTLLSSA